MTSGMVAALSAENGAAPAWHVLWTHSHCERLLAGHLASRGYEVFLPELTVWARRAGARRGVPRPMFPGYLFLRHAFDRASYLDVRRSRGLVSILGAAWDRLEVVPARDIDALRVLAACGRPCSPYPYMKEGARVRITRGPLATAEGFLVRAEDERGLLVVSLDLLQRSVAVTLDCTAVVPA